MILNEKLENPKMNKVMIFNAKSSYSLQMYCIPTKLNDIE